MAMKATEFKVGERVVLARVRRDNHQRLLGPGTVVRVVKSRDVVRVALDSGANYDAAPWNLDRGAS